MLEPDDENWLNNVLAACALGLFVVAFIWIAAIYKQSVEVSMYHEYTEAIRR